MSGPRKSENRIVVCTNGKDCAASLLRPREDFIDWLEESSGYWPWLRRFTAAFLPYQVCAVIVFVTSSLLMRTPRSFFFPAIQGFADSAIKNSADITGVMCIANSVLVFVAVAFLLVEFILWRLLVRDKEFCE